MSDRESQTTNLERLKEMRDYLFNLDSNSGEGKLVRWAIIEIEQLREIVNERRF